MQNDMKLILVTNAPQKSGAFLFFGEGFYKSP
ncbi:hypothetical protein FUAX_06350 [Fulvitalea axinellae]|uniref:Uncharacterized protein n=1 Tax=Fulvitalea axinellae TaxID=1182444 RepID=A0AAU9CEF2_9BACT|nr:hypothetical protein FUAX_06350 [Fulvitalea axinellae]